MVQLDGGNVLFIISLRTAGPKEMSIGRLLATLYAVLFLALSLFAGISFLQSYQELRNLRRQAAESQQKLVDAEQRLQEQERYLTQLSNDQATLQASFAAIAQIGHTSLLNYL